MHQSLEIKMNKMLYLPSYLLLALRRRARESPGERGERVRIGDTYS